MNSPWKSNFSQAGAVFATDTDDVLHFGDAAGELVAARDATVIAPLSHLAVLNATGDDAKSFLHGQLTSDINHLAPGTVQHAAWCSAKGRMLASFVVAHGSDSYRMIVAADLAAAVAKRLQMFVLRAKVKVTDASATHVVLGLAGPQAEHALKTANLPVPSENLTVAGDESTQVIHLDAQRYLILTAAENADALWTALSARARPVGIPAWRWLDVQAAFPLVTAATKEEFVPQMADFEKIGGVSFHKGCYPGQEIVARTQYLGKVKRHLYRVGSVNPLAAGDDLYSPENPDQSVGKLMSAAPAPEGGYAGLAVIQANFANALRLGTLDGPTIEATPVNPA